MGARIVTDTRTITKEEAKRQVFGLMCEAEVRAKNARRQYQRTASAVRVEALREALDVIDRIEQ
jgi:hypothetical protein